MFPELASTHPPELHIERSKIQVQAIHEPLDENVDLLLIQIPGGTFMMGSPDSEAAREDSEGPQHRVNIPNFWMGQSPVTQAQWRIVSQYEQVNRELDPDPSEFKGDRNPVENVSWYEAAEFCDRLSQQTGRKYRLPTEAEWEYACRAGTTTPFHFGETLSSEYANYNAEDIYGPGKVGTFRGKTTPIDDSQVGNSFGLLDMHGNVYEWCLDHWHENYDNAPTDGSAWLTDNDQASRILRGGSWINYPWYCRSASRFHFYPDNTDVNIGFRIVLAPR